MDCRSNKSLYIKKSMCYLKPTLGLIKLSDIHIRQHIFFSDGLFSQQLRQYPLIHRRQLRNIIQPHVFVDLVDGGVGRA